MTLLRSCHSTLGWAHMPPLLDRHHQLLNVFGGTSAASISVLTDRLSIGDLFIPSLRWVCDWGSGWVAGDPNESLHLSHDALRGGFAERMLSAKFFQNADRSPEVTQAQYRAVVVGPARTRQNLRWLAAWRKAATPHDCFTPPSWGQTRNVF